MMLLETRRPITSFARSMARGTRDLALVVAAASMLARCTQEAKPLAPESNEDIALTTSTSIEVAGGGSGRGYVEFVRSGPSRSALSLVFEGLPMGVGVVLDDGLDPMARSARVFYTLSADQHAVPGVYIVRVRATLNGKTQSTTQTTVTVRAAPARTPTPTPEITLSTASPTVTLTAGGHVEVAVLAARSGMWEDDVVLSLSGLPVGVSATFAPQRLDGWYNVTRSTLDLVSTSRVTPGSYVITLRAEYDTMGLPTETRVTLVVN